MNRRRGRLNRNNRFHQVRPRIRRQPSGRAALGVGQQNHGGADGVQQRDERPVRQFILAHRHAAAQKLDLRLGERIEDRVTHHSGAGKLIVQMRAGEIALFRRRREDFFQIGRGADGQIAVVSWDVGRAAARGRIHHVLHIAQLGEVVSPARASVGRLFPVGGRLPRAMHVYDGIGMLDLLGHPHDNVGVAAHRLLALFPNVLAACVIDSFSRDIFRGKCSYCTRRGIARGFRLPRGLRTGLRRDEQERGRQAHKGHKAKRSRCHKTST